MKQDISSTNNVFTFFKFDVQISYKSSKEFLLSDEEIQSYKLISLLGSVSDVLVVVSDTFEPSIGSSRILITGICRKIFLSFSKLLKKPS